MVKEVQQIQVTFIYSNPEVTQSPENLLGGCSISPHQYSTIFNLVVAPFIFLPFLSSSTKVLDWHQAEYCSRMECLL